MLQYWLAWPLQDMRPRGAAALRHVPHALDALAEFGQKRLSHCRPGRNPPEPHWTCCLL